MDFGLKGKVAIVTGGSDGIGKAAALSMSREGAHVAIAARTQASLEEAASEISAETGNEVLAVATDVKDEASVKALVDAVVEKWGRLDVIVNNAGTSIASRFEEMTDERIMEDFTLKVFGAVYTVRAGLPHLKKSGAGAIVNITTPGGKAPGPGAQPTSMSRSAGISLTKTWSKEFAGDNIRVNTVCIGLIKSGQHRRRWEARHQEDPSYTLEDHWKSIGANVPLGRVGEAIEAGDVIAFLASDRASYVTGTSVNIDGGTAPVL